MYASARSHCTCKKAAENCGSGGCFRVLSTASQHVGLAALNSFQALIHKRHASIRYTYAICFETLDFIARKNVPLPTNNETGFPWSFIVIITLAGQKGEQRKTFQPNLVSDPAYNKNTTQYLHTGTVPNSLAQLGCLSPTSPSYILAVPIPGPAHNTRIILTTRTQVIVVH
jgi:hypothetical protein